MQLEIPPFIPFPSSSNIYKINLRPIRLYLTLPTANCNAVMGRVCKSGYPNLSVNLLAAKNPDILMIHASGLLCNKSM